MDLLKIIIKEYIHNRPMIKKIVGVILIVIGLLFLVTPFTPGSWLIFVGLEFIGIRILFWDKIKAWFQKYNSRQNEIKRIVFIVIIILIIISFIAPFAAGY